MHGILYIGEGTGSAAADKVESRKQCSRFGQSVGVRVAFRDGAWLVWGTPAKKFGLHRIK